MEEFFKKTFYGSTVGEWLMALFIILATVILGRLIYWFFTKIVRLFTARTKTKLDDIIIDKIEEPIVAALVIGGTWYGLSILHFAPATLKQLEGFISLAIILNVAWLIVRTIDALIEEYLAPMVQKSDSSLDDAILPIARRGFSLVIWVVAVVIGLNNAGYDVATVLAGLGIGGLALAIGARTTIMNIFGGLTVLINQPFKIGDRIVIDDYDGYVQSIGLSITRIKLFLDNHIVTIPNRVFADKEVVNITEAKGIKTDFYLHIPVDTEPEKVQKILNYMKTLAIEDPHLNPDCKATVKGLNDYSLILWYIFYTVPGAPYWDVRSEVCISIMQYTRNLGVSIATRHNQGFLPEWEEVLQPKPKKEKMLEEDDDEF
ncbi:MAG: mechanosensitive ion channel family protein [Microscillaceae bacterium]|jgi:MscS family membrane protein|nr:mechanosensitive ion channel family protein [Microscillaceae bacterium]